MAARKTAAKTAAKSRAKSAPKPEETAPEPVVEEQAPEPVPADEPAVDAPVAEAPEVVTKTGHERSVEKVRDGVWWCPYCDHSQPVGQFDTCQGCGAKRGS